MAARQVWPTAIGNEIEFGITMTALQLHSCCSQVLLPCGARSPGRRADRTSAAGFQKRSLARRRRMDVLCRNHLARQAQAREDRHDRRPGFNAQDDIRLHGLSAQCPYAPHSRTWPSQDPLEASQVNGDWFNRGLCRGQKSLAGGVGHDTDLVALRDPIGWKDRRLTRSCSTMMQEYMDAGSSCWSLFIVLGRPTR